MPLYLNNGSLLLGPAGLASSQACCCKDCPAYPVKVYITGGTMFSDGYRSLEIQCLDATGKLVYQWRGNNGNFGGLSGTFTYSNGLAVIDPDPAEPNSPEFQGCLAVEVHEFVNNSAPPFEVFPVGQTSGLSHTVDPSDFECCLEYNSELGWCDNPQGICCGPCDEENPCQEGCECVGDVCVEEGEAP